jgi:hypothetical protein
VASTHALAQATMKVFETRAPRRGIGEAEREREKKQKRARLKRYRPLHASREEGPRAQPRPQFVAMPTLSSEGVLT